MTEGLAHDLQTSKRFEVLSRLGAGGFGDVFEAFDRERGARVAIKTLRTPTAEMIRALKREFRSVQDIQHPNLVRLDELFEEQGRWFFTMEFIRGVDFLQYVSLGGHPRSLHLPHADEPSSVTDSWHFDELKLRTALVQLVRGLSALHSAGKIYRDLKPSNVLVTPEGRAVIVDFGAMFDTHDGPRTDNEATIGTPHFMAPEQALGEEVGSPADWYGVGGILFYALTGTLPFLGTVGEILEKKVTTEAPAPSHFSPNLPCDLEDLCIDLLRSDPSSRPSGHEVLRRLTGDTPTVASRPPPASEIFVGRKGELAELDDASASMVSGGTVTVFLHGESGVGKSALIRTFTDRLVASSPEAVVVLRGRCYERESVPFKGVDGLIDSLSQFLLELGHEDVREILPEGFDLLCRAFPVLSDVSDRQTETPHTAHVLNPSEQRARLFTAARELFARVGKRWPLVLVVDDLQWTDKDSLALLLDVLRPPSAPRLLFVATMRGSAQTGAGGGPAQDQIARIEGDVRHIDVGKLPSAEAEELVAFLLGDHGNAAADVVRSIALEGAGHPLFIDELVRQRAHSGATHGPLRLDDALWERVTRLDPAARRLLEVVVVAGAPIQQEKASGAASIDAETLFTAAATLRNAHMIASGGVRSADHLEAYHDRVRESVLAHLDDETRKATHAQIAVAEEQATSPDAEALATHWEGASNRGRAAECSVVAGDRASRVFAFSRAVRWYRKALELGSAEGASADMIRRRLADALTSDGHEAEAAEVRLEIAQRAQALEALDLRRRAAEQFLISGHFGRGYALLRAVLMDVGERFPTSPIAVVFWVLVSRLRLRWRGLAFREVDPASLDAKELVRIDSVGSAGAGFAMTDNIRGAYFQTKNLLLALDAGDIGRITRALSLEVCFTSASGSAKRMRTFALLDAAKRLAARVGTPVAIALSDFAAAYASYMNGEWREAKVAIVMAEERFRDQCIDVNWLLSSARTILYRTLVLRGELSELATRLSPVLRTAADRGDDYATLNLRAIPMTMVHLAADAPKEALANIDELFEKLPKGVFHVQHYYVLVAAVELDIYAGVPRRGLERHRSSASAVRRSLLLRVEVIRVMMHDQLGRCALATAAATPPALSRDLLATAEENAAALGRVNSPWAHALGFALRAGICALRGNRSATVTELARAEDGFTAADMSLHSAAARRRLGQLTGGAEGTARVAKADAAMEKLGVRNPEAMTRLLAPGVDVLLEQSCRKAQMRGEN